MIRFKNKEHFDDLHGTELHQTDMDFIEPCDIVRRGRCNSNTVIEYGSC